MTHNTQNIVKTQYNFDLKTLPNSQTTPYKIKKQNLKKLKTAT